MKKYILIIGISLLVLASTATAATFAYPKFGGTGTSTAPLLGQILIGNQIGTYTVGRIIVGPGLTLVAATNTLTLTASSSITTSDWIASTTFGRQVITPSTTIPIWAKDAIFASSTLIVNGPATFNTITSTSSVGVATSVPGNVFAVQGNSLVSGTSTVGGLYATGTILSTDLTLTGNASTSGLIIYGQATTTASNGFNILGGCFAVNGACVGGGAGSGTVNAGTATQVAYYAGAGTTVSGTSLLTIQATGVINTASTSIAAQLSVAGPFSASSTANFSGLALLSGGFISTASSTISNTLDLGALLTTKSGFIASASSSIAANLNIAGPLSASSTLTVASLANLTGFISSASSTISNTFQISGNVGIGTSTPKNAKIAINGTIDNSYSSGTQPLITLSNRSGEVSIQPYGIITRGKYLFVRGIVNLSIFDISSSTPALINQTKTSFAGSSAPNMALLGNNIFVGSNSGFQVFNITNISNLNLVSSTTVANGINDLAINGGYLYSVATINIANNLRVFDVSDIINIKQIFSIQTSGSPRSMIVNGNYLYVTRAADVIEAFDISNPQNIVSIGTYASSGAPLTTLIQGNLLFILNSNLNLDIVNINNPGLPVLLATLKNVGDYGGVINGRYLFAGDYSAKKIRIIDFADPRNPYIVSVSTAFPTRPIGGMYLKGRYLYAGDEDLSNIYVLDIGGLETPSAFIYSLETTNLEVNKNLIIGNNIEVNGGINIGAGGIFSEGRLSILASTTYPGRISASFGNRVSIGTSTPSARLTIWGDLAATTSLALDVTNSASTSLMVITNSGLVGIGTSTPGKILSVSGIGTTTAVFDSTSISRGACLKLKDMNGNGYTYITTQNGAMITSTVSCEQ